MTNETTTTVTTPTTSASIITTSSALGNMILSSSSSGSQPPEGGATRKRGNIRAQMTNLYKKLDTALLSGTEVDIRIILEQLKSNWEKTVRLSDEIADTLTGSALDTDMNQQAAREEEYIRRRMKAEDQLAAEKAREEKKVMVHSDESSGLASAFKLQNFNLKTFKGDYTNYTILLVSTSEA